MNQENKRKNPFFEPYHTPHDTAPFDRIHLEDFEEAFMEGIRREDEQIDHIINNSAKPTFDNTIITVDDEKDNYYDLLSRTSSVFFNLLSAETNDDMDALAQKMSPILTKHANDLRLNERLFERIKYVHRHHRCLTPEEKEYYTRVLRGNLNLAAAHFRYGAGGMAFDYLAREPLWEIGRDYNHGTGHGVGYVLNVHEAPNSFHYRSYPGRKAQTVMEEGMVTSDEPGYYLPGEFGIRHENLLVCVKGEKKPCGQFMKFDYLTMVPFDLEAVLPEQIAAHLKDVNRTTLEQSRRTGKYGCIAVRNCCRVVCCRLHRCTELLPGCLLPAVSLYGIVAGLSAAGAGSRKIYLTGKRRRYEKGRKNLRGIQRKKMGCSYIADSAADCIERACRICF